MAYKEWESLHHMRRAIKCGLTVVTCAMVFGIIVPSKSFSVPIVPSTDILAEEELLEKRTSEQPTPAVEEPTKSIQVEEIPDNKRSDEKDPSEVPTPVAPPDESSEEISTDPVEPISLAAPITTETSDNGGVTSTSSGGGSSGWARYSLRFKVSMAVTSAILTIVLLGIILWLVRGRSASGADIGDNRPDNKLTIGGIENLLASDRPLDLDDYDAFSFGEIAQGISRFIRTEKTEPPLTLAVTGPWGSGKSSLMQLTKGDLERFGYRPIWFNAWHHQKDQRLLASLLEALSKQALLPFWHPGSWVIRSRILVFRTFRNLPVALVLISSVVFALFLLNQPGSVDWSWKTWSGSLSDWKDEDLSGLLVTLSNLELVKGGSLAFLVGSVAFLGEAIRRGLRPFGIKPATLMANVARGAGVRDLEKQAGFRHQFAEEFQTLLRALNPKRTVIFIDDLDRCRPESVLEVLEAVNFLTTCGNCFLIMGLDYDRILEWVQLGFKDAIDGPEKQKEFASRYMEKLINVSLRVPKGNTEQFSKLVRAKRTDPRKIFVRRIRRWLRPHWPVLALSLLIVMGAGYSTGTYLRSDKKDTGSETLLAQGGAGGTPEIPTAAPDNSSENPKRDFLFPPWAQMVVLGGLIVIIVAYFTLRRRLALSLGVVVEESARFKKALNLWIPALVLHRGTPRSMKRFINRVRFLATLRQADAEKMTIIDRTYAWLENVVMKVGSSSAKEEKENVLPVEGEPPLAGGEGLSDAPPTRVSIEQRSQALWLGELEMRYADQIPEEYVVCFCAIDFLFNDAWKDVEMKQKDGTNTLAISDEGQAFKVFRSIVKSYKPSFALATTAKSNSEPTEKIEAAPNQAVDTTVRQLLDRYPEEFDEIEAADFFGYFAKYLFLANHVTFHAESEEDKAGGANKAHGAGDESSPDGEGPESESPSSSDSPSDYSGESMTPEEVQKAKAAMRQASSTQED